jgi:hypothetical protein
MHDGLLAAATNRRCSGLLAEVCNPGAALMKTQSESPAIKRHNSFWIRDAFKETLGWTASRWILCSISKVLCIFIAICVRWLYAWDGGRVGNKVPEGKLKSGWPASQRLSSLIEKGGGEMLAVSSQTNLGTKQRGFESSK